MHHTRARVVVAVAALVLVAGCGQLLGGGGTATETVTPVPVPEPTAAPAPAPTATPTTATSGGTSEPNGRALAGTAEGRDYWAGIRAGSPDVKQPRYLSLRPTCERPPGLVIHIQVAALMNNDPVTDEGINTSWQFAAPSNRRVTGPFPNFVRIVTESYRPLLNASTVTYGPLERNGDVATRRVRVTAGNETTTYEWRVELQSEEPYVGCWMTTSVVPV